MKARDFFKSGLRLLVAAAFSLFAGTLSAAADPAELPLIPAPREIEAGQGKALSVGSISAIHADARSEDAARFLQRLFRQRYKRTLPIDRKSTRLNSSHQL